MLACLLILLLARQDKMAYMVSKRQADRYERVRVRIRHVPCPTCLMCQPLLLHRRALRRLPWRQTTSSSFATSATKRVSLSPVETVRWLLSRRASSPGGCST